MDVRSLRKKATRRGLRKNLALALLVGLLLVGQSPAPALGADAHGGWLGVEMQNMAGGTGARVRHVIRGSPAAAAGLQDGDVIVSIDDTKVSRADDVVNRVSASAAGTTVKVSVSRAGLAAPIAIPVRLAAVPDNDQVLRLDKVGTPAPRFSRLAAVAGPVPRSLDELRGKVVIVDFWATWCMACRLSVPKLSNWQAKLGPQGLVVIGITDDPVPEALDGMSAFGMRYPVASDESYATQRAFGVRALPTLFVIDKQGIVREVAIGFDPRREARLESLLTALLAEPAPPAAAP